MPLDAGELLLIETVRIALETFASRKELERRENRFRTYVENAPYGIFIADNEGRYVDVNDAACRVTGYPRDELLFRNLIHLIPEAYTMPKALRPFLRHDRRLFADVSRLFYRILQEFYHEAAGRPLLTGMVIAHQPFGDMLRFNPHFHVIVLEGGFDDEGTIFVSFQFRVGSVVSRERFTWKTRGRDDAVGTPF